MFHKVFTMMAMILRLLHFEGARHRQLRCDVRRVE